MRNNPFPQPICEQIWGDKYRLVTPNPKIQDDASVQDTWERIAKACAEAPIQLYGPNFKENSVLKPGKTEIKDRKAEFYDALQDFKFLPAGRIISGAGTGRNVTLFNCYVMGTIPDSMAGIFDMLKEAALTMQQGGGIGYDFSPLRPKNSPVKGVDADASGPLSFMDVWDSMCRTIMSAGSRRGAMMATLRCDHPDIEDFIVAKKDPLRLRMFNVSVLVTDLFMEAVDKDWDWALVHKTKPNDASLGQMLPNGNVVFDHPDAPWIYRIVKARDLWNKIMESTYNQAEPWVIFIDRINKMNNLWYLEQIAATNPCGEQPLPPYGACLLGSINLTKFVTEPFTQNANVDWEHLASTVRSAVDILDAVIDVSNFPLEAQKAEAKYKRRMGLGVTGLADMMFMMNLKYGSPDSINLAEQVMALITHVAYKESIRLAQFYGPCPATETVEQRAKFIESGFVQMLDEEIRDGIMMYGIRNSHLTSIAPTGTISLYAGNISSGVEPIFAPSYTRKVRNKDETKRKELVEDYAVKLYREYLENQGMDKDPNPENLVTAQTLKPMDHLRMQAAVQRWVDSSISKTINCPEDISFEEFKNVYWEAYKLGCKGCTTYRPNAITGSVLSVEPSAPAVEQTKPEPQMEAVEVVTPVLAKRSEVMLGATYKIKAGNNHAMYVSMTYTETNGKKTPYEVFVNSKNMDHFAWTVALTRMISAIFRRGGDVSFVVEELKAVFDPKGGSWIKGKYVPSDAAAIGAVIEQFMMDINYIPSDTVIVETKVKEAVLVEAVPTLGSPVLCSNCFGSNFKKEAGCETCIDCGHSKCG